MHVMDSRPSGAAVMTQGATEFFVRFDGPVDHARSMLTVLRDGRVVQALHPRLNSQPSVLYSGVRRLPPGDYVLHWVAASAREQDVSEGDIAFAVR
jgi:methionine-rich copper-binding protein CopC